MPAENKKAATGSIHALATHALLWSWSLFMLTSGERRGKS